MLQRLMEGDLPWGGSPEGEGIAEHMVWHDGATGAVRKRKHISMKRPAYRRTQVMTWGGSSSKVHREGWPRPSMKEVEFSASGFPAEPSCSCFDTAAS